MFSKRRFQRFFPQKTGKKVKVAKNMLKKSEDFQAVMLNYRNTPQQGHDESPYMYIVTYIKCSIRLQASRLTLYIRRSTKHTKAKEIYDRKATPQQSEPSVGKHVYAKPPTKKGQLWVYGEIINRDDNCSYTVKTQHSTIRQNH